MPRPVYFCSHRSRSRRSGRSSRVARLSSISHRTTDRAGSESASSSRSDRVATITGTRAARPSSIQTTRTRSSGCRCVSGSGCGRLANLSWSSIRWRSAGGMRMSRRSVPSPAHPPPLVRLGRAPCHRSASAPAVPRTSFLRGPSRAGPWQLTSSATEPGRFGRARQVLDARDLELHLAAWRPHRDEVALAGAEQGAADG